MSQPRDDRQDDLLACGAEHQPSPSAGAACGRDRLGFSGRALQLGVWCGAGTADAACASPQSASCSENSAIQL